MTIIHKYFVSAENMMPPKFKHYKQHKTILLAKEEDRGHGWITERAYQAQAQGP